MFRYSLVSPALKSRTAKGSSLVRFANKAFTVTVSMQLCLSYMATTGVSAYAADTANSQSSETTTLTVPVSTDAAVTIDAAGNTAAAGNTPTAATAAAAGNITASDKTDVLNDDEAKIAGTENRIDAATPSHVADKVEVRVDSAGSKIESTSATGTESGIADSNNISTSGSAGKLDDHSSSKEIAMIGGGVSTEVKKETADIGPVIIDNDEAVEMKETIEYKDLPTDEGGTKVKAGATFPVVISSQITSKSAKSGDPFEARLKYDLKIRDRMVAEKGSAVIGHVNYVLRARSAMHSLVSAERWYRNSGCLGVSFDEIVNSKGEHIPLVAMPAQQARIIKNKAEGRELGVNHNGQVTGPWSQQLRYKAVRIGLNAAMAPAGVFSFGAMPVALGVIGAANPSFAFMKPVGQNVRHRRIKGFVWGALSGVPGSWIVEDTVVKGQEAVIKPGDEFLAEFKEEFTGEPQTEAELIPGASTKVKGQVVPVKKGKK